MNANADDPLHVLRGIEDDHFYRRRAKRWHLPRFYRYQVADRRRLAFVLNRYPHHVLGACVVVGRWAYCVKWAAL